MCLCVCLCISVCACRVCVCVRACLCVYVVCVPVFVSVCAHAYSGVCYASVQYMCTCRGPDGDTLYIQWSNPIGMQCMRKGLILWGHNVGTKDQSKGTQCMYREPILWDSACSYTYLCVCTVSQVIGAVCHCTKSQL